MAKAKRGNIYWNPDPLPPIRDSLEWFAFMRENRLAFEEHMKIPGTFVENCRIRCGTLEENSNTNPESLWIKGPPQVLVYPDSSCSGVYELLLDCPLLWDAAQIKVVPTCQRPGRAPLKMPEFRKCLELCLSRREGYRCSYFLPETEFEGAYDDLVMWVNRDKENHMVVEIQAWQRLAKVDEVCYIHMRADSEFKQVYHLDGSTMYCNIHAWVAFKQPQSEKIANGSKEKCFLAVGANGDCPIGISSNLAIEFVRRFMRADELVNEGFEVKPLVGQ